MGIKDLLDTTNSTLDYANNLLKLNSGEELLNMARKDYKMTKRIALIGTSIIIAICVGIMYLWLRVLGR